VQKGLAERAVTRVMSIRDPGQVGGRIEIGAGMPARAGVVQDVYEGRSQVEQEEKQDAGGAPAPDERRGEAHARAFIRAGRLFFAHVSQRP